MRFHLLLTYLILLIIWQLGNPAHAIEYRESGLSASIGAEYTSGDYGNTDTTEIWYLPVTISRQVDRTYIGLTIPYISITGTGEVIMSGGHRIMRPRVSTSSQTDSGLGDIIVYGSYDIVTHTPTRLRIELGLEVKFGSADENKYLGTGEDDYAVETNIVKRTGSITYFSGVGYRVLGEPEGVEFDDIVYGHIGMELHRDIGSSIGFSLDAAQKASTDDEHQLELTLYAKSNTSQTTMLRPYFILGFSDGSPDWGAGISLTRRY